MMGTEQYFIMEGHEYINHFIPSIIVELLRESINMILILSLPE